ncbi:low-density lipoprotein receptor-like isoform X2 [Panonychus citri]|uniref:low-density lipoprotein receptor-like isoform X2 n=1 Tax=Panonychus citri TaxID=50023 RepID=UPI0023071266|nr:low-density lipoprotein receptor-like isoform X2 [Panonychus citri]
MKTLILVVISIASLVMIEAASPLARQNGRCYRCDYADCISYSHVCDGTPDCYDASDEFGCESVCPFPEYYRCSDTGLCMDSYHVCDGRRDCRNGEDEAPYNCHLYSAKGDEQNDLKKKFARSLE